MFMILIKIIQGIQHLIFYTLNKILNIQHPIIYSHCVHSFKEFLELKWIKWYFNRRILVSWSDTDTVDLILTTGFFFDFILTTGFSFDLILTTVFHLILSLPLLFSFNCILTTGFYSISFLSQVFSFYLIITTGFFHLIEFLPKVFYLILTTSFSFDLVLTTGFIYLILTTGFYTSFLQ